MSSGQALKCMACDLWSSSYEHWLAHLSSVSHQENVADNVGNKHGHESWKDQADCCLKLAEVNKELGLEALINYLIKWGTLRDVVKGKCNSVYYIKYDSPEPVNKILTAQKKAPLQLQGRQIYFHKKYEKDNTSEDNNDSEQSAIGLLASEYWDEEDNAQDNALESIQAAYKENEVTSSVGDEKITEDNNDNKKVETKKNTKEFVVEDITVENHKVVDDNIPEEGEIEKSENIDQTIENIETAENKEEKTESVVPPPAPIEMEPDWDEEETDETTQVLQLKLEEEKAESIVSYESAEPAEIEQHEHELFSRKMVENLSLELEKEKLENQLEGFCKNIMLEEQILQDRSKLAEELETILKSKYPDCKLYSFGMDSCGIGMSSDPVFFFVDLFDNALSNERHHGWETNLLQEELPQIFQILKLEEVNKKFCCKVRKSEKSLRFIHLESQIQVNLDFFGYPIVQEAILLKFLCGLDPRVRPLLVLARYWSSITKNVVTLQENVNNGRLMVLLMVFHLSNRGVIPSLAKLQSEQREKKIYEGIDLSFCLDKEKFPQPNAKLMEDKTIMTFSALSLLKDFFQRFGLANFKENAISLWYGKFVQKVLFIPQNTNVLPDEYSTKLNMDAHGEILQETINTGDDEHPLCIQDLFDMSKNLTLHFTADQVKKFQSSMWKTGENIDKIINSGEPLIMDIFLFCLALEEEERHQRALQLEREMEMEREEQIKQQREEEKKRRAEEDERRRKIRQEQEEKWRREEEEAEKLRNEKKEDDNEEWEEIESNTNRNPPVSIERENRQFIQDNRQQQYAPKRKYEENVAREKEFDEQQKIKRQVMTPNNHQNQRKSRGRQRQREGFGDPNENPNLQPLGQRPNKMANDDKEGTKILQFDRKPKFDLQNNSNTANNFGPQHNQMNRESRDSNFNPKSNLPKPPKPPRISDPISNTQQQQSSHQQMNRDSHNINSTKPSSSFIANTATHSDNRHNSRDARNSTPNNNTIPKNPPIRSKNNEPEDWLNTEWEEFSKSLEQPITAPPASFLNIIPKRPIAPIAPSPKASERYPYPVKPPPPPPPPPKNETRHAGMPTTQIPYNESLNTLRPSVSMESDSSDSSSSESDDDESEQEQESEQVPYQNSRIQNPFQFPKLNVCQFAKNLFIEGVSSKDFGYGIRGKFQTLFLQFMKEFNNRFWKKCFGFDVELDPTYQDCNPADYAKFMEPKSTKIPDLLNSVPCFEDNFVSAFFCQSTGQLSTLITTSGPNDMMNKKFVRKKSAQMLKVLMEEEPGKFVPSNQTLRFKVEVAVILDYSDLNKDCKPFLKIVFDKGLSTQNEMLSLFQFFGKLYKKMAFKFLIFCYKRWLRACADFDLKATEKKCNEIRIADINSGKNLNKKEKRKLKRLKRKEKKLQKKIIKEEQLKQRSQQGANLSLQTNPMLFSRRPEEPFLQQQPSQMQQQPASTAIQQQSLMQPTQTSLPDPRTTASRGGQTYQYRQQQQQQLQQQLQQAQRIQGPVMYNQQQTQQPYHQIQPPVHQEQQYHSMMQQPVHPHQQQFQRMHRPQQQQQFFGSPQQRFSGSPQQRFAGSPPFRPRNPEQQKMMQTPPRGKFNTGRGRTFNVPQSWDRSLDPPQNQQGFGRQY